MTHDQNISFSRRSRYGLIAFIVLIGILCEIYSHKLSQLPGAATQPAPSATSTFTEPTAPPTAADAIAPSDPHIDTITPTTGPVGSVITVTGESFSGFEGDLTLWIQNDQGEKGILYATNRNSGASTTPNAIDAVIPQMACSTDTSYSGAACPSGIVITPGTYQIFTSPWGKQSNPVQFTVTAK